MLKSSLVLFPYIHIHICITGGGSTANIGLLLDQSLYIANIGDTRAVLSRAGFAHELSEDHKPDRPSGPCAHTLTNMHTYTHDTHTLTHKSHTHTHIHTTHIHTRTRARAHTWMLAFGAHTVLLTRHFAVAKRNNDNNNDKNDNSKMILTERARIEALDGRVEWRGCWRVMGGNGAAAFRGLAISRLSSYQYVSFASVQTQKRPVRRSFCVWIRPGTWCRSLARLGYLQGIT